MAIARQPKETSATGVISFSAVIGNTIPDSFIMLARFAQADKQERLKSSIGQKTSQSQPLTQKCGGSGTGGGRRSRDYCGTADRVVSGSRPFAGGLLHCWRSAMTYGDCFQTVLPLVVGSIRAVVTGTALTCTSTTAFCQRAPFIKKILSRC